MIVDTPTPFGTATQGFRLPASPEFLRPDHAAAPVVLSVAKAMLTEDAVNPVQAADRLVQAAAETMYKARELDVTSFHDERSGRFVVKIADRSTNEVLAQLPSEDLLRFFAAGRGDGTGSLVDLPA